MDKIIKQLNSKRTSRLFRRGVAMTLALTLFLSNAPQSLSAFLAAPMADEAGGTVTLPTSEEPTITIEVNSVVDPWVPETAVTADALTGDIEVAIRVRSGYTEAADPDDPGAVADLTDPDTPTTDNRTWLPFNSIGVALKYSDLLIPYDWEGNPNTPNKPALTKAANFHSNFNTQLLADYSRTFADKHTVGATLGIEASGSDYDNLSASRQNYVIDVDQMGAGPTDGMNNGASEGISYRRAAMVARLKYDYAAKYIIEANMRYDGSDLFPQNRRWGAFFSGSAAWVVSEERFWETLGIKKALEQFKIRASYGEIGLDSGVGRYSYMSSYSLNQRGA